jgi:phosphonate transport system substrate-binding protein
MLFFKNIIKVRLLNLALIHDIICVGLNDLNSKGEKMNKNIVYLLVIIVILAAVYFLWPSPAPLGSEENPIQWGLVPSGESERVLAGFSDVADMIFKETGLYFETSVATEYTGVIEAMCSDPPQAHMSSLATFSYIIASDKGCADVGLVATRYGSATYSGQIFVRADSGITSVADVAGLTFCRASATSTSSWIIPTIVLNGYDIDPTDMVVVDAGSHEGAVAGVYNGDCDLGASYIDARTRVEGKIDGSYEDIMEAIVVLEIFEGIPNDGVQFVPSMDAELREQIVAALLVIAGTEAGAEALNTAYNWNALEEHDDTFYDQFRQFLDASGVIASDYSE